MQQNISSPRKDLLNVKTVFGTSAIPKGNSVYVQLPDGRFMYQPISMIKPGQKVLFRKDGMDGLTLETVGEALIKSERYAGSIRSLFVRFGDESLPIFQQALLFGIIEKPEAWPQQISADAGIKALFALSQPIQLSDAQRTAAAEFIHTTLAENGASEPVGAYHIECNWLEGNVVAPRNRNEVVGALSGIAPGLSAILDGQFTRAYHAYIAIRQSVMRAVSSILRGGKAPEQPGGTPQPGGISGPGAGRGEKFSVAPEINLVIKHFASDISAHYLSATVVEVKDAKNCAETAPRGEKRKYGKGEATEKPISLFKGIVTEKLATDEVKIKPLSEIALEINAMRGATLGIVTKMVIGYNIQMPARFRRSTETRMDFALDFQFGLMHSLGLPAPNVQKIYKRMKETCPSVPDNYAATEIREKDVVALAKEYVPFIADGSLDGKIGLPPGTCLRLLRIYSDLRMALPTDLYAAASFRSLIEENQKAEAQRQANQPIISFKNEQRAYEYLTKNREIRDVNNALGKSLTKKEVHDILLSLMPDLGESLNALEMNLGI